ncbi:MAG: DUF1254 domain-containing protein [Polyangiaceae bacterium]
MDSAGLIRSGFERAYPTAGAAAAIADRQDLGRAVEAYRFFYPTVSMEALFQGLRDDGVDDNRTVALLSAGPRHVGFTANSDTPYAAGVLDFRTMGPIVVEVPPGPYIGLFNDHHQRWIADMGIPGPDGGKGAKYLIVPPEFSGGAQVPAGYYVARAETHKVFFAMRALPIHGDVSGAFDALRRVKIYPLAQPGLVLSYVDLSERALDFSPLRWEDNLAYWRQLAAIIDSEPTTAEFRPMYGELAALGIERRVPFSPTSRMKRIFDLATRQALEQMRVEAFASQRPDRIVWKGRQWEWVGLVPDNGDFETNAFLDLQARDRWFFQAILASPAMFRRKVGAGSVYFLAARDASGAYLDGGKTYKLVIPQPVPAKLFWSITAYDSRTRSQVQAPMDKAVLGSLHDAFETNGDGAVEVYFGPEAPAGKERQWIQTMPNTGFFLYFRIYGPEGAALDGTWHLADLMPIDARGDKTTRVHDVTSSSTPDVVASPMGELHFRDGMPTRETASRLYDQLDLLHGVDAFLDGLPAVSFQAMRRGMLDVGVEDNDVLLFSGLMDSSSRFLTPNCDTVYFFTFLDLSKGPLVFEVPERVLGVLNDMWSRWVGDVGLAGPDRGEGGRYLIVPESYDGPLPEGGYFVAKAKTSRVLVLGRAFLENDDPAPAVRRIKDGLKIYPYVPGGVGSSVANFLEGNGPFYMVQRSSSPRFVEGTGLEMNAIVPSDRSYFDLLDDAVQQEAAENLEPEMAGHFAAIGIVKGRRFQPGARMRKVLDEAVNLGNAAARTLAFRAREEEGFGYYGASSAWSNMLFVGGYDFLRPPPMVTPEGVQNFEPTGDRKLHARIAMFYLAFGITPAMCMRMTNIGSQYLGAMFDAHGSPLDGSKTYTLMLPPNIPAAKFWSVTLYDNQTRSMLQTPQRFPRVGSQAYPTAAARSSGDGSVRITFSPERPIGVPAENWVQTVPGKGWFALLRLYSPLAAFFDKSWRPSEIELVK